MSDLLVECQKALFHCIRRNGYVKRQSVKPESREVG
jgi:hypothetical protein